jgi:hypothetical protein
MNPSRFPIYIPNKDAPAALQEVLESIAPGSAIVGHPDVDPAHQRTLIYYEAADGASEAASFADRARSAARRLSEQQRTVAKRSVTRTALTQVGWLTPERGVEPTDAAGRLALAGWLDLLDGDEVDAAAL